MSETITNIVCAGIDVGKARLDVAIEGDGGALAFANTMKGLNELTEALRRFGVARVGLEASGGYEREAVRRLRAEGFEVIVLQPIQVRAFARYRLQRAKNDKIDARLICACTVMAKPPSSLHDPRLEALCETLTFIEQLEEDIARNKTRQEGCRNERLKALLVQDLKRLKALRLAEIKRLLKGIAAHSDLNRRLELILSVPGIGPRTGLALLIRLPELGKVSREAVAALVGVAPYDHDSGKHSGQRRIAGGRPRLRKSLYAAALPAVFHWNLALKALYDRLKAKGKPHAVALVACVRKLVIYANTVVQRDQPWVSNRAS